MKSILATTLALALTATTGVASAQTVYRGSSYGSGNYAPQVDRYGQSSGAQYDYARVVRVDPVLGGYGNDGYNGNSNYGRGTYTSNGQRCYENPTYVSGDRYGNGAYGSDAYRNDGYRNDGYRQDDGYYDQYGNYRRTTSGGSQTGSTMATVIGGVVGAVLGSQVGGGSARYATSAIGSMVGGVAGRQIYEQSRRQRDRTGTVRVCDPVPVNGGYASNDRSVSAYDVTYEYAGRTYTTRTNYHPGDRIRVRVDVRPE